MSNLAFRMAAAMRAAGFNQPGLSRAASRAHKPVSQQVVQHLLSGRNSTSSHLPAIAEALGVSLEWLATGREAKVRKGRPEALLIGNVGAGGEVKRLADGPVLAGVESPPDAPNLVMIGDDSQFPLQAGWLVFYGPENQRVPVECIGKLCVLQIKDGPTLLKILKRSPRKGLFRLENWNTSPLDGVKLDWAARVRQIQCDSGQ